MTVWKTHADRGEREQVTLLKETVKYKRAPLSSFRCLKPENKGNCEPEHSYEVPVLSFKD